ncbi:MAG: DUF1816 domain-containing protein [Crinalium sp.]
MKIKEALINICQFFGFAWWIEIVTQHPRCTYYFGPFLSTKEATAAKAGYLEDLQNEGAQGISFNILRCKPENLTIADDLGERFDRDQQSYLSGQVS